MKVLIIHEREVSADASEVGSAPKAARVGKLRPYPFSIYAQYQNSPLFSNGNHAFPYDDCRILCLGSFFGTAVDL